MSILLNLRLQSVKETDRHGKAPQSELSNVFVNNSGSKVITVRLDGSLRIWRYGHTLSDPVTLENPHNKVPPMVSWEPSTESIFATVGGESKIKLWTLAGRLDREITGSGRCRLVQYSPDGQYLAVVNESNELHLYEKSRQYSCVGTFKSETSVNDLKWSNQGHLILVLALSNGTTQLVSWDEKVLNSTHSLSSGALANCVLFDIQGRYLAVGSEDGIVYFWRTSDLVCARVLMTGDLAICGLSTDRDGAFLCVSFCGDVSSKVYDYESLEEVMDLQDQRGLRQKSTVGWYPSLFVLISSLDRGRTIAVTRREARERHERHERQERHEKRR